MEQPVPPPRKMLEAFKDEVSNEGYLSSDISHEETPKFVHVAEVHSSRTQLLGTSDEDEKLKIEKRRKKRKRSSTFIVKDDNVRVYNSDEIEQSSGSSKFINESDSTSSTPKKFPIPLPRKSLTQADKPEDSPRSYTSSSNDYKDTGVVPPPRSKHKKSRSTSSGSRKNSVQEGIETAKPQETMDKTAICLTIHGCEPLRMKDFHTQPFVKVHTLDIRTNSYRMSAFGKMKIDPIHTHSYYYTYHRSVVPKWDEDLIIMEPVSHIASLDTLLIFELLESETEEIIAWAFLRPVAVNGALNVGKKLRLQLYKPSKWKPKEETNNPKPFYWWMKAKMNNYPSTLFVTLNSISSDIVVKNEEIQEQDENTETNQSDLPLETHVEDELNNVVWSRLPSLSCKLPNKIFASLSCGPEGGMAIAYDHAGLLLACHTSATITIFTFKGTRYLTLIGHHGLVYNLSWSDDDNYLLSSSADCTACIWDIANKRVRPFKVLPHPSYVYGSCWLGTDVITGSYDNQIRLWKISDTSVKPFQTINEHKARVNALCQINGDEILVSGDGDGLIIFWKMFDSNLIKSREIRIREIRNKIISNIKVHPAGRRLLIHTRDSMLRMIDIASGSIIQWFHGGINTRLQTGSGFCGCGSRVLLCSEDGSLSAWDAHTGERIARYETMFTENSPAFLSSHPKDHMMAIVTHSVHSLPSIFLLRFEKDEFSKEIGLVYENISDIKSNASLSSKSSSSEIIGKKKHKKRGIFRSLLGLAKNDKTVAKNDGFSATYEKTISSLRKYGSEIRLGTSDIDSDHRLSDIIKRMDKVLVTVLPNKAN